MAEPLKLMYNTAFLEQCNQAISAVLPQFDSKAFVQQVQDNAWDGMELKQRMRHLAVTLRRFLPESFPEATEVITAMMDYIIQHQPGLSFQYMFLPDIIEIYGLEQPDTAMMAFEKITRYSSCEFAVRPFIDKYPDLLLPQMLRWSEHEHHAVRRFSSEGCRPRLPWGIALAGLKKDPSPILPILENLKADPSEFVRKSVANNINDISKDNPETAIHLVKKWKGHSGHTDWILKHGSRTLLKQAHPEVLELFGLGGTDDISVAHFQVNTPEVKIGSELEFSFSLNIQRNTPDIIRLEYAIYYLLANGKHSKKVFKISEKSYDANSVATVKRRQSFKLITTRTFYPGSHRVAIIVNGRETDALPFLLISP